MGGGKKVKGNERKGRNAFLTEGGGCTYGMPLLVSGSKYSSTVLSEYY